MKSAEAGASMTPSKNNSDAISGIQANQKDFHVDAFMKERVFVPSLLYKMQYIIDILKEMQYKYGISSFGKAGENGEEP